MINNAHVIVYKGLLVRWAAYNRLAMAQLIYYTDYMLEINPAWKPAHIAGNKDFRLS